MESTSERSFSGKESGRLSSPTRSPLSRESRKPKKAPTVTPRRLKRFFTPRPASNGRDVKTSRSALESISSVSLNKISQLDPSLDTKHGIAAPNLTTTQPNNLRKRKLSFPSAVSSSQPSPAKRVSCFQPCSQDDLDPWDEVDVSALRPVVKSFEIYYDGDGSNPTPETDESEVDDTDSEPEERSFAHPVGQYRSISTSTTLLSSRLSGRRARIEPQNSSRDLLDQTAHFYTTPYDRYSCRAQSGSYKTLPFCITSCNTNSLVAIGDEEGCIRLVDSCYRAPESSLATFLYIMPHNNAVLDLAFSDDDALIATGSGDKTCLVIDMRTQKAIACLAGHEATIKRIQFQPASNNQILATCSRDGMVNLWDLRVSHSGRSVLEVHQDNYEDVPDGDARLDLPCIEIKDQIHSAHDPFHSLRADTFRPRSKGVSVTSLSFLPNAGRSHLLLTTSEIGATVKLWDLRTTYHGSRTRPAPISTTAEPIKHGNHRSYGITSLAHNGDGSRFYALCRDNTVYTYATSHLILGNGPELSAASTRPRRRFGPERRGLGPLYGFRHERLHTSSFYVRLNVRPARNGHTELLAVGSSEDCAMLFPTDERYLTASARQKAHPALLSSKKKQLPPHSRPFSHDPDNNDTIPIYTHGTPLIRGHQKEVSCVAWTWNGYLTTISDDLSGRVWKEDEDTARVLRMQGEGGGRRWRCGWAEVAVEYDDEVDEATAED